MKRAAFDLLKNMEDSWWYRGRALSVRAQLARAGAGKTEIPVLDFGAGFGGMHDELARLSPTIDAFEPDEEAKKTLTMRGYRKIYEDADAIEDGAYALVGAFDVVEHIEDDRGFLIRIRRALAEHGRIAISVPAFPFLWSVHDETHLHFRRYTKKGMRALLAEAGYRVESASYWNATLFYPAAAMRLLGQSGEGGLSLPGPLNMVFLSIVKVESIIMRFMPLPWGTGLVVIARKAGADTRPQAPRNSISALMERYAFFIRYLIVGVSGGIVQTATLYVWIEWLRLSDIYLWGVVIGFLLALAETFLLQKYWTFRDRTKADTHKQFISYTLVALVNLGMNTFFIRSMKEIADAHRTDFFHIWYLVAQMGAVVLVAALSFFANYFITFRSVRKRAAETSAPAA